MTDHRRPLVKAAVAGALLCGLCFVPSANATIKGDDGAPSALSAQDESEPAEPAGTSRAPYVLGALGAVGASGVLIARYRATPA